MVDVKKKKEQSFLKRLTSNQLFIPLMALILLAVINLINDPGFLESHLEQTTQVTRFCQVISSQFLTMAQSLEFLQSA